VFVSQLVDGVIYVARRLAARERKIAAGGRGSGRFAYLRGCALVALCLRSSRHFQCCRSHGAKEPC